VDNRAGKWQGKAPKPGPSVDWTGLTKRVEPNPGVPKSGPQEPGGGVVDYSKVGGGSPGGIGGYTPGFHPQPFDDPSEFSDPFFNQTEETKKK
jgi:hypothetical protein